MKKITGSVHLASTSVGLAEGVFSYLCEIIHSLSGGSFGIDLASIEDRHLVLPPPSEGPLVLITGQKQNQGLFAFILSPIPWFENKSQRCRSLPCILHTK